MVSFVSHTVLITFFHVLLSCATTIEDLEREIQEVNYLRKDEVYGLAKKPKVVYGEYAAYMFGKKKSWEDATEECKKAGKEMGLKSDGLATPMTVALNEDFEKTLPKKGTFWIGLQLTKNGELAWNGVADEEATLYFQKFEDRNTKTKGNCASAKIDKKTKEVGWVFEECKDKKSYICGFIPSCEEKKGSICFKGTNGKNCLSEEAICDGYDNCQDGLDEKDCSEESSSESSESASESESSSPLSSASSES